MAVTDLQADVDRMQTPGPVLSLRWSGVLGFEGIYTTDGRALALGALTFDDLPRPLMATDLHDGLGHEGAARVGQILEVQRWGQAILARGTVRPEALREGPGAALPQVIACGFDLDLLAGRGWCFSRARLMGATLYLGSQVPAFPNAAIVLEGPA